MYQEIEKTWTQDSGDYNDMIRKELSDKRETDHWMQELKEMLGEQPLKILDVGCGPGFLSIMLTRLGHQVKAVDGSEGMIRCASKNFLAEGMKIEVQQEDGVELPEEEKESYDVIISRDVIWTLYHPKKAFIRWKEILKPNGKILYYDGNYQYKKSMRNSIWKAVSKILILLTEGKVIQDGTESDIFKKLPMVTSRRPGKDLELLREAGFRRIRITNDNFRNSFKRMEYWKYGYQGKKFRVIAWKNK